MEDKYFTFLYKRSLRISLHLRNKPVKEIAVPYSKLQLSDTISSDFYDFFCLLDVSLHTAANIRIYGQYRIF